jgi:prepilin-type N-terminal cleavage/methylation domain-containing protein
MKNSLKKIVKGFSLIEVVIAVNLLALILAILGLSVLGSQKLLINTQTRNEISKIGEGILDYVCSLPISDRVADPTIPQESPNNNIYSISDFVNGTINNNTIINQNKFYFEFRSKSY